MLILQPSFPEILSIQVSKLVCRMKDESKKNIGSVTGDKLRDKITTLTQSQLMRATDALAMIWDGMKGPLEPRPTTELEFALSVTPPPFPNWHRVKLALLKSISTGTFIDIQFYAFNKIGADLPFDLKPLFTSSIVIEEWGPAITTRELEGFLLIHLILTYPRRNSGCRLPGRVPGGWADRRL
jgi:hypothetical protein